jgi:hypothetical protein
VLALEYELAAPAVNAIFHFWRNVMKKQKVFLAAIALMASSSIALAAGDFTKADANADGMITLEEGRALHADWTADSFKALDTNADGSLNQTEYETAVSSAAPVPSTEQTTSSTTPPAVTAPAQPDTTAQVQKGGPARYLNTMEANDVMASSLIGARVYAASTDIDAAQNYPADARKDWSDIGEVNDVVLDLNGQVKAVVLGVGGFLGMGEKDVAIDITSLQRVRESADSSDWFLVVNSTKDALSQAPAYVRNSNS